MGFKSFYLIPLAFRQRLVFEDGIYTISLEEVKVYTYNDFGIIINNFNCA